jgi:hypothetical protein
MEQMIARWIRETQLEYELAKKNINTFKMVQMKRLLRELSILREKLL